MCHPHAAHVLSMCYHGRASHSHSLHPAGGLARHQWCYLPGEGRWALLLANTSQAGGEALSKRDGCQYKWQDTQALSPGHQRDVTEHGANRLKVVVKDGELDGLYVQTVTEPLP